MSSSHNVLERYLLTTSQRITSLAKSHSKRVSITASSHLSWDLSAQAGQQLRSIMSPEHQPVKYLGPPATNKKYSINLNALYQIQNYEYTLRHIIPCRYRVLLVVSMIGRPAFPFLVYAIALKGIAIEPARR